VFSSGEAGFVDEDEDEDEDEPHSNPTYAAGLILDRKSFGIHLRWSEGM